MSHFIFLYKINSTNIYLIESLREDVLWIFTSVLVLKIYLHSKLNKNLWELRIFEFFGFLIY